MTKLERVRIRRVEQEITRLQRLNLPYVYGGGRTVNGVAPNGPFDCSSFAEHLCDVADIHLKTKCGTTRTLAGEGKSGTSPVFTLFIKNNPGGDEHVIVRLRRRPIRLFKLFKILPAYRWAECGGSDNPKPAGGPTWFKPTTRRIAEFPIHRHFEELKG